MNGEVYLSKLCALNKRHEYLDKEIKRYKKVLEMLEKEYRKNESEKELVLLEREENVF